MKAPDFLYRRPDTPRRGARTCSRTMLGEAQVLAGGQSLMPTLNMRLSSPGMLVDINRIAALRGHRRDCDSAFVSARWCAIARCWNLV